MPRDFKEKGVYKGGKGAYEHKKEPTKKHKMKVIKPQKNFELCHLKKLPRANENLNPAL